MKKIYIIGIGGAGTSALALIYEKQGLEVVGSDDGDGFYIDVLRNKKIKVYNSFDESHITSDIDIVVYTTAIDSKNCEFVNAKKLNIQTISYPEAIGQLTKKYKTIAVCGTHGKTTTTALTAYGFIESNLEPIALVGSKISQWRSGAYVGSGEYFVLEADEYQNKLTYYTPYSIILTSVDFDHPDFFDSFEDYKKVFCDFVSKIPEDGFLVACGDDDNVREIAQCATSQVFFYGKNKLNSCQIIDRITSDSGQIIKIRFRGEEHEIKTQLFGLHNAKNAVSAWLMTFLIVNKSSENIFQRIVHGINKCVGTARRFERKGKLNGAILIDDYAHHPVEIEATLKTAKEVFGDKKIIIAFHPHTFSRTEALLDEFAKSLSITDEVIVLDIFASAREKDGNITSQDLVDKIDCNKKQNIHTIDELANWMKNNLTKNDVFLTLGAGDIWKVYNVIENKK